LSSEYYEKSHTTTVCHCEFRVKLVVLGPPQCGKSSLVQSLLQGAATVVDTPTEGVNVDLWAPFQYQKHHHLLPAGRNLTEEEQTLVLELWDTSGRQVCQAVHGLFIAPGTVCVITYDVTDGAAAEKVLALYRMVQQKCLGSPVIIVGTKVDQLDSSSGTEDSSTRERILQACQKYDEGWRQELQTEMDDIKQTKKDSKTPKATDGPVESLSQKRLSDIEQLLKRGGRNASPVLHTVSASSGKGLDAVRKTLLQTALNSDIFPLRKKLIRPSTTALFDHIIAMRERDLVLLPWQQFNDLVSEGRDTKKKNLEEEIAFLESVGVLIDFRFGHVAFPQLTTSPTPDKKEQEKSTSPKPDMGQKEAPPRKNDLSDKSDGERYVCVHPAVLAGAIFYCYIDDDKKAFRFEAGRFWPRDSGFKHPDPHMLCRVLEAIPQQGLLREGLLPLLWQEYPLSEDQVLAMLHVLQGVGLMVLHSEQKKYCEGMALPAFPKLSVKRCHALPLLNLLPDNRPQLNWTAKPFAGDMQITWCFNMAVPVHAGLIQRLLAFVVFLARDCNSYTHFWKTGVLLRIGEATVCAEQQGEGRLELACRVNGDEVGREPEAMRMLWVTLAPFLQHVRAFLHSWPGIEIKETVLALGQQFYLEEKVDREPELWALQVMALWHRQTRFIFTDGDVERQLDVKLMMPFKPCNTVVSVDTWLQLVVSHTETALKEASLTSADLPPLTPAPKDGTVRGSRRASLKNGLTSRDGSGAADDKKQVPNGRVVSEEEEKAEANRLASGFVAAILATAVADYIAQEAEGDQDGRKMVSAAQITAARVTADAALAVQTGNIDGAANAVIDAVNSVHSNSATKSEVKVFTNGRQQSKLCVLL
ncbi:hypothetical protein BaRGS_00020219, partial [Batillaria attramentaria]